MGDASSERNVDERPVHTVFVSGFYLSKKEVTYGQWKTTYQWALERGYRFDNSGDGKGDDHPVVNINWFDAVKWCNAESERQGLPPVYCTDAKHTEVYRQGRIELLGDCVNWDSQGYRLPTEAEWEKAARGPRQGARYPWGNTVTHEQANFASEKDFDFDISPTRGHHPRYQVGPPPFTSPVCSFPPNDYGLCDISGNAWEFCWDWYDPKWYKADGSVKKDTSGPKGPTPYRAMRGGGWDSPGRNLRCAVRDHALPARSLADLGFRLARSTR